MSSDRAAIERLIFEWDAANDRGDFAALGALMAGGALSVEGMDGSWRGAEEVTAQYAAATRLYPTGGARTHHLSTNIVVTVDTAPSGAGTVARARSYYTMMQSTDDLPFQLIDAGWNDDRFELVDGTWTWRSRHIHSELHGDLSHHLAPQVTPFVE
jgi:ketosteroid isomerase-like protein